MSYTMYINDFHYITYDVTELASSVTYTTTLNKDPGSLSFRMLRDPLKKFFPLVGYTVRFYNNNHGVFKGKIYNIKITSSEEYEITCYDSIKMLMNKDSCYIPGMTMQKMFNYIFSVPTSSEITSKLETIPHEMVGFAVYNKEKQAPDHIFVDESYFDILQYYINDANMQTVKANVLKDGQNISVLSEQPLYVTESDGSKIEIPPRLYFVRDRFGTIELNDVEYNVKYRNTSYITNGSDTIKYKDGYGYSHYLTGETPNFEPVIIGDESLLIDYDFETDISKDICNEVIIVQNIKGDPQKGDAKSVAISAQKPLYTFRMQESIDRWGLMRKIISTDDMGFVGTPEEIVNFAQTYVYTYCQPFNSMNLECLGIDGMYAGDGFYFQLKKFGIGQMMYIISATHNYDGDKHTMNLEVSTSRGLGAKIK